MSPSSQHRKKRAGDGKSTQPSKKHKKNAVVVQEEAKGKGKGRDEEFQVVTATLSISVSPAFAQNPQGGVEEMLDSLIMRSVGRVIVLLPYY